MGLQQYEVSNFCAPGHSSAHNLTYWHGADYLGIGPGMDRTIMWWQHQTSQAPTAAAPSPQWTGL